MELTINAKVEPKRKPGRPRVNWCVFCQLRPDAGGKCRECNIKRWRLAKYWKLVARVRANLRLRLHRALAAGTIVRGPCVKCGAAGEEGILVGVESVSDVIWVCKKHGWEVRKERRARVKALKEKQKATLH